MKKDRKIHILIIIPLLLTLVLFMGVTFALYTQTLETNKTISLTTGKKYVGVYGDNKNNIEVDTKYTFTIENRGIEDATYELYLEDKNGNEISDLSKLTYFYTRDGTMLTNKDNSSRSNPVVTNYIDKYSLNAGEKKEIKFRITAADSSIEFPLKLKINFNAAKDDTSVSLCKQSISLHAEICNYNAEGSSSSYCSSNNQGQNSYSSDKAKPIVYGRFHAKNTNMANEAGIAFDCDVNNDGIYDQVSERFYFVSFKVKELGEDTTITTFGDVDSSKLDLTTAVLIYYTNTRRDADGNLVADSTATGKISYHEDNINTAGPVTAVTYLPTKSQWTHSVLTNQTLVSNIYEMNYNLLDYKTNGIKATKKLSFNYSERNSVARFLTIPEIVRSCAGTTDTRGEIWNIEVTDANKLKIWDISGLEPSCLYLFENTAYSSPNNLSSYWLDILVKGNINIRNLSSSSRSFTDNNPSGLRTNGSDVRLGVRPVIEVKFQNLLLFD